MDKGGRCEKEAGGEERGNHVAPPGLHGNFPDDKKQQKCLIEARFFSPVGFGGSWLGATRFPAL